jgi:hypothetical protein
MAEGIQVFKVVSAGAVSTVGHDVYRCTTHWRQTKSPDSAAMRTLRIAHAGYSWRGHKSTIAPFARLFNQTTPHFP